MRWKRLGFFVGTLTIALSASVSSVSAAGKCHFRNDDGQCLSRDEVDEIDLIKKGTPYSDMRRKLIALGYEAPISNKDPKRCDSQMSDICARYPEAE